MSHESKGLRITGDVYLQRYGDVEQPVIGPLPAEYVGAAPQAERKTVLDTRRNRRGQVLFALTDPQEPVGKLTLLSVSPKVLAMSMLGEESTLAVTGGSETTEEHLYTADYGIQLDNRNVGSVVVYPGVRATLATGVENNDNAITWTAVAPGAAGNSITVTVVDPAGNNVALSVAVDGTDIVVTCATDGSSAITSTAAQVMAAIEASAEAAALVTVADTGTSDGSGVVVAVSETALATGSDTGTAYTAGTDYEVLDAEEGIVRPISGGGMGASGTCFISYDYGTITGTAVNLGTDVSLRCRVVLAGTNDTDANAEKVRWEAADCLLTPAGELNLVGTDPIKAEFDLVPLTPTGADTPVELSWPTFGAV